MTWPVIALVALGGGLGAVLRAGLQSVVNSHSKLPVALLAINLSGSFALGVVTGAVDSPLLMTLLGVGLLGGFTTFSSASVEAVDLARSGSRRCAVIVSLAMLLGSVLAVWAGLQLGHLFGS